MAAPITAHCLFKTKFKTRFCSSYVAKLLSHGIEWSTKTSGMTKPVHNGCFSSDCVFFGQHCGLFIRNLRKEIPSDGARHASVGDLCLRAKSRSTTSTSSNTADNGMHQKSTTYIQCKLYWRQNLAVFPLPSYQSRNETLKLFAIKSYCSIADTFGRCWKCHVDMKITRESGHQFFCSSCNAIQPVNPDSNHFHTMKCEETFDIEPTRLTQTFRNLQRKLHPDKFSISSQEEQKYSAMQSSQVNKAYSTLLKPLSRGLYLLELNGLSIEEGDAGVAPKFLMEIMEINEELAETGDIATVNKIGQHNTVKLDALLKELSQAFSEKDFPRARQILISLKYFTNIDDKVKEILENF